MSTSSIGNTPAASCDVAPATRTRGSACEGESQPRPVIRGESHVTTAHIDWFACTFLAGKSRIATIIENVLLVPRSEWKKRSGGWQGYETRIDLGGLGVLAYGGEHQRGTVHVELNAHGCAQIQDWNAVRVGATPTGYESPELILPTTI